MYVWQIISLLKNGEISECYVLVDMGSTSTLFSVSRRNMLEEMGNYDTDMFVNAYVDSDNNLIVG